MAKIKNMKINFVLILWIAFGLCTAHAASSKAKICIVHATDWDETRFGAFPWPRKVHADLVEKLQTANPKLIVLKYLFDQPSAQPENDQRLMEALEKNKNVILPFSGTLAMTETPANMELAKDYRIKDESKTTRFLSFANCAYPIEMLALHSNGVGSFDVNTEPLLTQLPAVVKVSGQLYPSLPLIIVAKALGYSCRDITAYDGKLKLGSKTILMDSTGSIQPEFTPPGKLYKTYTYSDILDSHFKPEDLKDSIIIIGYNGTRFPVNLKTKASNNHNGSDINADGVRALLMEVSR